MLTILRERFSHRKWKCHPSIINCDDTLLSNANAIFNSLIQCHIVA